MCVSVCSELETEQSGWHAPFSCVSPWTRFLWPRPSTYEQLKESEEFAFVVTDIESSTELSQQDPIAFQQVRGFCLGSLGVRHCWFKSVGCLFKLPRPTDARDP